MLEKIKKFVLIRTLFYIVYIPAFLVFIVSLKVGWLGIQNICKANRYNTQLSEEYKIEEKQINNINKLNGQLENKSVFVGSITLTTAELVKDNKASVNKRTNKQLENKSVIVGSITLTTSNLLKNGKNDINQINTIDKLNKKLENRGVFGDSAGLLTASFAGLAFFGFLLSYISQQKELKARNKDLNKQQFESTFFNMLKTQENIIYNLNLKKNYSELEINSNSRGYKNKETNVVSRQVFEEIFNSLKINYNDENNLKEIKTEDIAKQNYELIKDKDNRNSQAYSLIQNLCNSIGDSYWESKNIRVLSNYFTFMYRIIKFVDENTYFTQEEKSEYVDILRATLSTYELLMLFYNALSHNKMKKFIIEYQIFNNISYDLLKKNVYLYKLYVSKNKKGKIISAYGDRLKEIEKRALEIYDKAINEATKK